MLQTKNLLSAAVLLSFVVLAMASSNARHATFDAGSQIPPDFNKFEDTLLVIKHPEDWGYDHYLVKNFAESYTGKYKMIKASELVKYPPETYKYVFDQTLNYSSTTRTTSTPVTAGGHMSNGPSIRSSHTSSNISSSAFFLKDRQLDKSYYTASSAAYSKMMRAYLKALEEYRHP